MLRVDRIATSSRRVLFVVIGAVRIECGVMLGTQWIKDSLIDVSINVADGAESPIQAMTTALQNLQVPSTLPSCDEARVMVCDYWLAMMRMPWSPRMTRAATADTYIRAQLTDAGFDIGATDTLKLGDAPFGEPFLAVVYPSILLASLNQFANRLNTRLTSILPLSVAAWAFTQGKQKVRPQALAVLDVGFMALVRGTGVDQTRLSDVTLRVNIHGCALTDKSLREEWQRMCLRDPQLIGVKHVALLDLTQPDATQRAVDRPFVRINMPFQGDKIKVSPVLCLAATTHVLRNGLDALPFKPALSFGRWLALGVVSLLVGALSVQALQTNLAIRSIIARQNAMISAVPLILPAKDWSREELAQVQAVNMAIRELNLPILPIMRALEPPPSIRVAVLSMETTGSPSTTQVSNIKIVAEAHTGDDMTRYVAFVAESKPFTGAYLTRHEIDKASGQRYRFTVEATWSE